MKRIRPETTDTFKEYYEVGLVEISVSDLVLVRSYIKSGQKSLRTEFFIYFVLKYFRTRKYRTCLISGFSFRNYLLTKVLEVPETFCSHSINFAILVEDIEEVE